MARPRCEVPNPSVPGDTIQTIAAAESRGGNSAPPGVEAPQVSVGCLIAVIKAGTAGGGQVWVVEMAAGA